MSEWTQQAVPDATQGRVVGSRMLFLDEVGSTNDCALGIGGDGTVVVAESQTQGRGRHGRTWYSGRGLGLWFSVAFEGNLEGLSFAATLAVRDVVARLCPVSIKWPNDLLTEGKKIGGILVEHRQHRTVLGVGLNVHHRREDFPEDVRDRAISIDMATQRRYSRRKLLKAILARLDERVRALRSGQEEAVWWEWAQACAMEGRRVWYRDIVAVVTQIDRTGALILTTPLGERRVVFGEVIEQEHDQKYAVQECDNMLRADTLHVDGC